MDDEPQPTTARTRKSKAKTVPKRSTNEIGLDSTVGKQDDDGDRTTDEAAITQTGTADDGNEAGNVTLSSPEPGPLDGGSSLAREETRAQASNRWILEGRRWETENFRKDVIRRGRESGLSKDAASEIAWAECLAKFPPGSPPVEPAPTIVDIEEPVAASTIVDKPVDLGVSGLGDMPPDWPTLPANAPLQVEIAWVSANRLRVRSGSGVDLSRALGPAPSYSALSWLETSILFPSKFADISVKATAQQDDEKEHIQREKMAIEEIRGLLKEMLEG